MKTLFCVIGLVLTQSHNFATSSDVAPISPYIVNGADCTSAPWHAMVIAIDSLNKQRRCGGSIINQYYVLTSGQCTEGFVNFEVTVGTLKCFVGGTVYKSSSSYIHPSFNGINHDIAVIKTPKITLVAGKVELIKLMPLESCCANISETLQVIGCGRTQTNNAATPTNLKCANVKSISNLQCSLFYSFTYILPGVMCTIGLPLTSPCYADNGGSLVLRTNTPLQEGIVSFFPSSGCGSSNPSGYVRVCYYIDWLRQVTGVMTLGT